MKKQATPKEQPLYKITDNIIKEGYYSTIDGVEIKIIRGQKEKHLIGLTDNQVRELRIAGVIC
jgi:hypothetical protein